MMRRAKRSGSSTVRTGRPHPGPHHRLPALPPPPAVRASFETWFLPLHSWHATNNIDTGQLAALLTHFHRARLTAPERPQEPAWRDIQQAVEAGSTTWLTRKAGLATAVGIVPGTAS